MYCRAVRGSVSALSVQLDSERCDIPNQPLSWIFCMSWVQLCDAGMQKR